MRYHPLVLILLVIACIHLFMFIFFFLFYIYFFFFSFVMSCLHLFTIFFPIPLPNLFVYLFQKKISHLPFNELHLLMSAILRHSHFYKIHLSIPALSCTTAPHPHPHPPLRHIHAHVSCKEWHSLAPAQISLACCILH